MSDFEKETPMCDGALCEKNEETRMRCILSSMRPFVRLRMVNPVGAEAFIKKVDETAEEECHGFLVAAVEEQVAIIKNTDDNVCGYHLNCIHSGKTVYSVIPYTIGDEEEINYDEIGDLDFDTEAEAEAACAQFKHADIMTYDPDELWAVLNRDNKNEKRILYRNSLDALFALYQIAKPEAFMRYMNGCPITHVSVERDDEQKEVDSDA